MGFLTSCFVLLFSPNSLLLSCSTSGSVCVCVCVKASSFWMSHTHCSQSSRVEVMVPFKKTRLMNANESEFRAPQCKITSGVLMIKWLHFSFSLVFRVAPRSCTAVISWFQQVSSDQSRCEHETFLSPSRAKRTTNACSASRAKSSASQPCDSTAPVYSARTLR